MEKVQCPPAVERRLPNGALKRVNVTQLTTCITSLLGYGHPCETFATTHAW